MIPPSANYSPLQAPMYPPPKYPYTPNMLTQDDSKVLDMDRLNVGEVNILGYLQNPSDLPQGEVANPSADVYMRDQRNDYVPNYVAPNEVMPYSQGLPQDTTPPPKQDSDDVKMIQNSPILTPDNVIELSAIGMGVALEFTILPSQALAKRVAIIDAYRQIGENMYDIGLNAQDMVLINSIVNTKVKALIKNAEIIETIYKDGLCQITMELKLDEKIWHKILSDT